jgi:hypothetical protein
MGYWAIGSKSKGYGRDSLGHKYALNNALVARDAVLKKTLKRPLVDAKKV